MLLVCDLPVFLIVKQLCSGMDENAVGTCSELIFAPIDASFADDAPLLPSGFRIIPLDTGKVSLYIVFISYLFRFYYLDPIFVEPARAWTF